MTITKRDIVPAAVLELVAGRGVDYAVDRAQMGVDARVLGMDMIDRSTEGANGGDRVGAHPDEMAGIEIGSDRFADRVTQPR